MVVFDCVVTSNQYVVAVAGKGQLCVWDARNVLEKEGSSRFDQETTSVYKPIYKGCISEEANYAIEEVNNNRTVVVSAESLRIFGIDKLESSTSMVPQTKISNSILECKFADFFNVVVPYRQKLLIGTAGGKIMLYDITKQTIENEVPFPSESAPLVKDYQRQAISSMAVLDNCLVSGTKGGFIKQMDLSIFKYVGDFRIENTELSPVNTILAADGAIHVGHQDYISRWGLSGAYTGSYSLGFECSSLLKTSELVVAGNVPEIHRIVGKTTKKWDTSSDCTLALRHHEGLVYTCGSCDIIDIFNSTSRVCSLITL